MNFIKVSLLILSLTAFTSCSHYSKKSCCKKSQKSCELKKKNCDLKTKCKKDKDCSKKEKNCKSRSCEIKK
ncbi:MAG: hypothetical protein N4A33_07625 [Bacteriovoracaceae bacterium]|jgi:hypothetical protein|nr:hypothetical protein [Bacteriovoracaceae bacterium]